MGERLVADSVMTPDGDVVLPGPVDKDGHRVPFDTTDLYGLAVSSLYLKAPDSWKKLLEDLDEGANHSEYSPCFYFRKDMCDCSSCEADRYSNCDQPAFKDIASRIRKLRGEGDAD